MLVMLLCASMCKNEAPSLLQLQIVTVEFTAGTSPKWPKYILHSCLSKSNSALLELLLSLISFMMRSWDLATRLHHKTKPNRANQQSDKLYTLLVILFSLLHNFQTKMRAPKMLVLHCTEKLSMHNHSEHCWQFEAGNRSLTHVSLDGWWQCTAGK